MSLLALILVWGAAAAWMAVRLQRLDAFFFWWGGIFVLMAVINALLIVVKERSTNPTQDWVEFVLLISAAVLLSSLVALSFVTVGIGLVGLATWLYPLVLDAAHWLRGLTGKGWLIAATGAVTVLCGAAFFAFRLVQRFLYGVTEAIAGAAIAAHRVSLEPGSALPSDTGFYVAVLTAGVYLVVRGLDNMYQAIQGEDSFVNWLRRRLQRTMLTGAKADVPPPA